MEGMPPRHRACRALLLLLLLQPLGALGEETTRAYRGLWGGLFRQQAGSGSSEGRPSASERFRQALADLQSVLHPSIDAAVSSSSSSGGPAGSTPRHLPSLDEVVAHVGNLTASLLEGAHSGSGGTSALLQRLARDFNQSSSGSTSSSLDAAQLAATVASMQAWALAGLVARSGGGSLSSGSGVSSLSGSLDPSSFKQVADPAWTSFKPSLQARLQNFGAAEGYNAALLGTAPCGRTDASSSIAAGCAAASADALRWGSQASFLLDCSRGSSDASHSGSSSGGATAGGGSLSAALHAAASKAASAVEAALDRTTSCRLAVASEGDGGAGGSGALLHHSFERPLLGGVKLDALRIRVCNIAPSTLQYPAALVRGPTISVSSLKLNGRPLLRAPLHMSQAAAAADGCLALLYRLPSRATKNGFALSGFMHLGEGSSGEAAAAAATGQAPSSSSSSGNDGGGQFGVGEMASLELTLGEYSALDAAASRLLGGIAGSGQAAGAQP